MEDLCSCEGRDVDNRMRSAVRKSLYKTSTEKAESQSSYLRRGHLDRRGDCTNNANQAYIAKHWSVHQSKYFCEWARVGGDKVKGCHLNWYFSSWKAATLVEAQDERKTKLQTNQSRRACSIVATADRSRALIHLFTWSHSCWSPKSMMFDILFSKSFSCFQSF